MNYCDCSMTQSCTVLFDVFVNYRAIFLYMRNFIDKLFRNEIVKLQAPTIRYGLCHSTHNEILFKITIKVHAIFTN